MKITIAGRPEEKEKKEIKIAGRPEERIVDQFVTLS
jgi:hypothetical protein